MSKNIVRERLQTERGPLPEHLDAGTARKPRKFGRQSVDARAELEVATVDQGPRLRLTPRRQYLLAINLELEVAAQVSAETIRPGTHDPEEALPMHRAALGGQTWLQRLAGLQSESDRRLEPICLTGNRLGSVAVDGDEARPQFFFVDCRPRRANRGNA